jgi:catechol 2,3-dioxygenase-like lactoylglutathione lyase family enzyme
VLAPPFAPPPPLSYDGQVTELSATPPLLGLRHLALYVARDRFAATLNFYREGMGMQVDWQPDDDAVYLTSGSDNLALHRVDAPDPASHVGHVDHVDHVRQAPSGLDHLGFMVPDAAAVEAWHDRLHSNTSELGIEILSKPRLHRDGATSFYLLDPAGNKVQILHMPLIKS